MEEALKVELRLPRRKATSEMLRNLGRVCGLEL